MKDGELIILLADTLDVCAAMLATEFGLPTIPVVQKDQPTQQGTNTAPTIYFQKLFDVPRGQPQIGFEQDPDTKEYFEVMRQLVETHFQISGLYWQDPEKQVVNTASDMVVGVHDYFMFPSIRQNMANSNVRILRVDQVRNPPFENDEHKFEYQPNFDIILSHVNERRLTVPTTNVITGTDYPV